MKVSEAIRAKRAVRSFADKPLEPLKVRWILNAGRRAQSSKNEQVWHFIALTDKQLLAGLSECGQWADHLARAALGVAILTQDPSSKFQVMFDAGQAAAYMQLAAWELGVVSCLASIYDGERARRVLGFPVDLHLRIAISFGYPLDPTILVETPRQGGRRRLDEVVHYNGW